MLTNNILIAVATGVLCSPLQASHPILTEQDLIYNNEQMLHFSIEDYLMTHAPHLSPHAETISHWAGFTTISPKILIALMEHQSSIISIESSEGMSRPFGTLSDKVGFDEQLKEISNKLATLHYEHNRNPNHLFSVEILLSDRNLLQSASSNSRSEPEKSFSQTYFRLFPSKSH
jgi:LasA protease